MKLSVVMPAYNERDNLEKIIDRVLRQKVEGIDACEILLVDDASTDGTREVVEAAGRRSGGQVRVFFHDRNRGKCAAIRTAIPHISGEVCIIQDADLEYDPSDYPELLWPIIEGKADCVFGSRFVSQKVRRVLYFWHYVGNTFLTLLSNMVTNLNLSDMETCYKAFRSDVLKAIPLKSERFGFEPEITAKVARRKLRIYEVGISYSGRTYEEGKKITWVDGCKAIYQIIRYGLFD